MRKEELKKIELYCEKDDDGRTEQYFLRAEYEIITKYKKSKVIVDKISLPIRGAMVVKQDLAYGMYSKTTIDFGFGELYVTEPIHEIVIEEYPQKMTLKEIEKKLGYKVEVVSER